MHGQAATTNRYIPRFTVGADDVLEELKNYMLVDGFDFVLDFEKSHSAKFVDARTGKHYTDFFTCFASVPFGVKPSENVR